MDQYYTIQYYKIQYNTIPVFFLERLGKTTQVTSEYSQFHIPNTKQVAA
jgi:hypothetical protein